MPFGWGVVDMDGRVGAKLMRHVMGQLAIIGMLARVKFSPALVWYIGDQSIQLGGWMRHGSQECHLAANNVPPRSPPSGNSG
jgi:hypothetical protein